MSTAPVGYASTEIASNATLTASGSYTSNPLNVAGSGHVELEIVVGGASGTTPSLTVNLVVIEPVSGTAIKTYSATAITTAGTQYLVLDNLSSTNNLIGDNINVTWTITGTTPSFTGVYIRLIQKESG